MLVPIARRSVGAAVPVTTTSPSVVALAVIAKSAVTSARLRGPDTSCDDGARARRNARDRISPRGVAERTHHGALDPRLRRGTRLTITGVRHCPLNGAGRLGADQHRSKQAEHGEHVKSHEDLQKKWR